MRLFYYDRVDFRGIFGLLPNLSPLQENVEEVSVYYCKSVGSKSTDTLKLRVSGSRVNPHS
jgi:hypothetical protein